MIVIYIILGVAAVFGIIAYASSNSGNPKDRAAEAAGAAAGGAMMAGGCLFQLIIAGLVALAGIWLIAKIFF
jgi:uncharacterized membrane protein YuzA (DUF378 family)